MDIEDCLHQLRRVSRCCSDSCTRWARQSFENLLHNLRLQLWNLRLKRRDDGVFDDLSNLALPLRDLFLVPF